MKIIAKKTLVTLVAFIAAAWVIVASAAVLAQMHVQTVPAEGHTPDMIIIKRSTSDYAQICVEPTLGGFLVCRNVKDLRRWAEERYAK